MPSSNNSPNNKTVLVIVAHTDDETIGAGGAISKHVERGDSVFAIAMTDGVSSRNLKYPLDSSFNRHESSINASKVLGFKWLDSGQFPDNEMDTISLLSVVKFIEKAKELIKPHLIYTHSSADLNIDHQIVSLATLTAFRPEPKEIWTEIRTFEIPSATDFGHKSATNIFSPNLFINISTTFQKKIDALNAYSQELKEKPHSRSIEGIQNLAMLRGNQSGLDLAEAFEIIRKIER